MKQETGNTQAEGKGARGPAARRPTIDHVTLWAGDLPASRRFYEAALAPLGFGPEFEHDGLLAFGSGESGRLILYAGERSVAGVHLAFSAPSPEAVDAFHAAAMEAGATTARRGRGPSTTEATTAPTSSTPMATTSRRSTTPFPPDRVAANHERF